MTYYVQTVNELSESVVVCHVVCSWSNIESPCSYVLPLPQMLHSRQSAVKQYPSDSWASCLILLCKAIVWWSSGSAICTWYHIRDARIAKLCVITARWICWRCVDSRQGVGGRSSREVRGRCSSRLESVSFELLPVTWRDTPVYILYSVTHHDNTPCIIASLSLSVCLSV